MNRKLGTDLAVALCYVALAATGAALLAAWWLP